MILERVELFKMMQIACLCLTAGLAFAQYEVKESGSAQKRFPWPDGKRCAVCLTFDDARFSQIDHGIPLLNEFGVKATFYISPERFVERIDDWKQAVQDGHEIGNHTMSHPCTGNYAFSRDNALEEYTIEDITREIDEANGFIQDHLGVRVKSFAYPCGQKFVGRGHNLKSYIPLVADRFVSGRGWLGESANDPWFCDLSQLLGMESDGKSFDDLKALIDGAAEEGRWLILAGHEMGEPGPQTTLMSTLQLLCAYAGNPENKIWIATVGDVAAHILNIRSEGKE